MTASSTPPPPGAPLRLSATLRFDDRPTSSSSQPQTPRPRTSGCSASSVPSRVVADPKVVAATTPSPCKNDAARREGCGGGSSARGGSASRRLDRPIALPHGEKTIYFIRHGQSTANVTPTDARRCDASLVDCGLTARGIDQSLRIRELLAEPELRSVELVITSPLTRALATAVLAFPDKPILVHYDLGEFGGIGGSSAKYKVLPENTPRSMDTVLQELEEQYQGMEAGKWNLDATSMRPPRWPTSRHVGTPTVVKRDRVCQFVRDFVARRPESVVAVVAHSKVIQTAMSVSSHPYGTGSVRRRQHREAEEEEEYSGQPRNAVPIPCRLTSSGITRLEAPRSTPPRAIDDDDDDVLRVAFVADTSPPCDTCTSTTLDPGVEGSPITSDCEGGDSGVGRSALPKPISLASRLESETR